MKTCSRCKIEKKTEEFYRSKQTKDGFYSWCKDCAKKAKKSSNEKHHDPARRREYVRRYRERHPDRVKELDRKYMLKRRYGITPEQYDEMLAAQDGVCAICKRPPGTLKLMPVDHCHASLENRGILCTNCNTALGLFEDNVDSLIAAVRYLRPEIPMMRG